MDSTSGEEWLVCKKDNRQEALEHDPNAVGVYKESSEDSSLAFVGHVPIELSTLVAGFLDASKKHSVSVQVCGKRKREVGPIVPGLYRARTKKRRFGKILVKEIKKITERYRYFDFSLEQDIISKLDLKKRDTPKTK